MDSCDLDTGPLAEVIRDRQLALGKSDEELSHDIGFATGTVIALIKCGTMKMPVSKIPALARALGVDAKALLTMALTEQSPELLAAIREVYYPLELSATEVRLIEHCRRLGAGGDTQPIVFSGRTVVALVAA